jgi:hypothetical protein
METGATLRAPFAMYVPPDRRPSRRLRASFLASIAILSAGSMLTTLGCGARSELPDADAAADAPSSDGGSLVPDAPGVCGSGVHVGSVARAALTPQLTGGVALDPAGDRLLLVGGLSADGVWAQSLASVDLSTGDETPLTVEGDTTVALGPVETAVWDVANGRAIVLGGGFFEIPMSDPAQVFLVTLEGTTATLQRLPDFPGGTTGDLGVAAVYDPGGPRVLAIEETIQGSGSLSTYALDLTPGGERWSLVDTDPGEVAGFELFSAGIDPVARRLVAVGYPTPVMGPASYSLWALSLDAPGGWRQIPGTFPPSVVRSYFPFVYDPASCAFVTALTGTECLYELWRIDVADAFSFTSLGVATQPTPRFLRSVAAFDAVRRNFVFGSAFDCFEDHEAPAGSLDLVGLTAE